MTARLGSREVDAAARRALIRDMLSHGRVVADLRRTLFRRHVALNVRSATPLLHIVARSENLDLDAAVAGIEPPRSWPHSALTTDARRTTSGIDRDFAFLPGQIARRHRNAGVIVRRDGRDRDVVGVRILGPSVELTVVRGALRLDTFHGFARVLVEGPVPDTLMLAMTGRPVSDLIDHPWLRSPDWRVVFAVEGAGGSTAVVFETGQMSWRCPPTAASSTALRTVKC